MQRAGFRLHFIMARIFHVINFKHWEEILITILLWAIPPSSSQAQMNNWMNCFKVTRSALNFLLIWNGAGDLNVGSVGIPTFVLVKQHTPADVQNVRKKSPPPLVPSFIIASFRFTRLFILLIMFANGKRIFRRMSSHVVYPSGRWPAGILRPKYNMPLMKWIL